MPTIFEYMIKIAAGYALVYLFYWLVLRRLTNYKSNRFYLLSGSMFAFIIPFLRLDLFIAPKTINTSEVINSIPALNIEAITNISMPGESGNNIPVILMTLFIGGVAVCLLYFIMQLISFKRITSQAGLLQTANGISLYHLDMDIMPFSFGRSVYVNMHRHTPAELDDIIQHESVHAKQNHTVDVILAEIICMLSWYNPFAWLIKHAIRQNLEFLADDTVLKTGADKKSYQYLLLKVTGYSPLNIASSFKLSSLKQRIYMMNKTKTSQRHLLKLLLVLPIIAVMMLAFRNDGKVHVANTINNNEDETFMLSQLSYNIQDTHVDELVKSAKDKSLLQPGKSFSITTIKNERDRLRALLEKNGYSNINSHAITFMLDSTFENNRCAIEINIDLRREELSSNNSGKQTGSIATSKIENDDRRDVLSFEQSRKPVS